MEQFDEVLVLSADGLTQIRLSSDGKPSTLGPNDPRKASWMLRDLELDPAPDTNR